MEFKLSFNNKAEEIELPVPPPSFEIQSGNNNTVVNVNEIGELNLIGSKRLDSIQISSFFPAQEYSFCKEHRFIPPYELVDKINSWRGKGKPIRLIITDTPINMAVSIENFTYGERDGTRDVYYDLELKQYRFLKVMSSRDVSNSRPSEKETPKTYVVKPGDTLYDIAKRTTGKGSNYKSIAQKNGIKDPNIIYPGQKLVIK